MQSQPETTGASEPNQENLYGLDGFFESAEYLATGIIVVVLLVSAITLVRIVQLTLRKDSKSFSGRRQIVWLAITCQAIVSSIALILLGGMLKLVPPESMATLLTILVTAIGVKLFDGLAPTKPKDESQENK